MLAPSSNLLRTGLALKLSQIKLATRSYLRDRTNQATGTVASYAGAAGLFAAAGIFLVAACLVGVTGLFRWIEINYGPFWAFGAVAALLLVIAAICAAVAAGRLKRPPPHFPSLASRLRVAIKAGPLKSGQIEPLQDGAAAANLTTPSAAATRANRGRQKTNYGPVQNNRNIGAGLILTATLLGWAATRRRQQARRADV
jgi:Putative Actinobacterial Holin-X, holin superfamily III